MVNISLVMFLYSPTYIDLPPMRAPRFAQAKTAQKLISQREPL